MATSNPPRPSNQQHARPLVAVELRREHTLDRTRRIDAAAVHLVAALQCQDTQRAESAIEVMLGEGLTQSDVVAWCQGEVTEDQVAKFV